MLKGGFLNKCIHSDDIMSSIFCLVSPSRGDIQNYMNLLTYLFVPQKEADHKSCQKGNELSRPFSLFCVSVTAGVCFSCEIDVVPVKNEDGLVIMFILNFELPTDPRPTHSSPASELNRVLRIPWLTMGVLN